MIWHNSTADDVISELKSDKLNGLSSDEATSRLLEFGKNEFQNNEEKSILKYIFNEFKSITALLLLAVAVIYWILISALNLSGWQNSLIVIIVTLLTTIISAICKCTVKKHNLNLKNSISSKVTVIRDGKEVLIGKELLVPGDIMVLKSGDYVRADARIIDSYVLKCDEYFVSGETVPVDKIPEAVYDDITPLSKRFNMIYCGSVVVNGKCLAIVTETAESTEIGRQINIALSINTYESALTAKLEKIRKSCNTAALILFLTIFFLGILVNFFSKENFAHIVTYHFFLSLATYVATFTWAIPTLLNLSTALSTIRLKAAGVSVKNTETMEKLKDVSVICTDKTGALTTENLSVVRIFGGSHSINLKEEACDESARAVLRLALICSNFKHSEHIERHSNSIERAIEKACIDHIGASKADIDGMYPTLAELPFDSERRIMTTVTAINGNPVAIIKGAPEVIIERCNNIQKSKADEIVIEYAKSGLKVMAVAIKQLYEIPANPNSEELENDLTFTGIIGFEDEIDQESAALCRECEKAGIKVIMLTGDHLDTAITTALKIGIISDKERAISSEQLESMTDKELADNIYKYSVFARITPNDKLRIVSILQSLGENVLVTGDILGDAPALYEANIGCALGRTASDLVKDVSEIVVNDNRFSSIIKGIRESGTIFENIKRCLSYYFTFNLTIFATVILGLIVTGKSPLTIAGIMLLSVFSLVLSCVGFLTQEAKTSISVAHRAKVNFDKAFLLKMLIPTFIIPILTVVGFSLSYKNDLNLANGIAFAIVAFSLLTHIFSISLSNFILFKGAFNSFIIPTVCGIILAVYLINLLTPIGTLLSISTPTPLGWILTIICALLTFALTESIKLLKLK